jgi:hypothetical protein
VWLLPAVNALVSVGGRAPPASSMKQRIVIAAAVAKEVHSLMLTQTDAVLLHQLGFSPRRVLQDPTGAQVRLGSGFDNRALKATAQRLGLTPPASVDHHSRLDAAYRRILARLWTGQWCHTQTVHAWIDALQGLISSSTAKALTAPLLRFCTAPPPPRTPFYVHILGDGHCWYSSVARAEGKTNEQLRAAITAALAAQPTTLPACLSNISLIDGVERIPIIRDAASAQRAIESSLQTRRVRDMWFAGEEEMVLYSMAEKGAVRFLVFSSPPPSAAGSV